MIAEADKKQINRWNDRMDVDTILRLVSSPDKRSEELQSFCHLLSRLAPRIKVSTQQGESGPGFMEIGGKLRVQAIPEGKELEQLLEALAFSVNSPKLSNRLKRLLDDIIVPAELKLFITPQCPHCPLLFRQLLPVIFSAGFIRLTVIDGLMFTELAKLYGVKSVPSLFLDDDFQWNGMVGMEELLMVMAKRDLETLSQNTLTNLLKEGKAAMIAEMMSRHEKLSGAFLKLLAHDKWPIRLGAMVAFEEIIRINPALAVGSISSLLDEFSKAHDQAKGDILYLLGLIGSPAAEPFLETIKNGGYNGDVMESAMEALESIRLNS